MPVAWRQSKVMSDKLRVTESGMVIVQEAWPVVGATFGKAVAVLPLLILAEEEPEVGATWAPLSGMTASVPPQSAETVMPSPKARSSGVRSKAVLVLFSKLTPAMGAVSDAVAMSSVTNNISAALRREAAQKTMISDSGDLNIQGLSELREGSV